MFNYVVQFDNVVSECIPGVVDHQPISLSSSSVVATHKVLCLCHVLNLLFIFTTNSTNKQTDFLTWSICKLNIILLMAYIVQCLNAVK